VGGRDSHKIVEWIHKNDETSKKIPAEIPHLPQPVPTPSVWKGGEGVLIETPKKSLNEPTKKDETRATINYEIPLPPPRQVA